VVNGIYLAINENDLIKQKLDKTTTAIMTVEQINKSRSHKNHDFFYQKIKTIGKEMVRAKAAETEAKKQTMYRSKRQNFANPY